jgi:hypothetical protein
VCSQIRATPGVDALSDADIQARNRSVSGGFMIAVVDTNVLLSAALRDRLPEQVVLFVAMRRP